MPDTAWPIDGTPARLIPEQPQISGSDVTYHLTTLQQRFTCVRLPDPHLTALPPPFPHRSPRRSSTNAACGGLVPSPAGRHRGAKSLISRTAPHREALLPELPSAFVTHVVWDLPLRGRSRRAYLHHQCSTTSRASVYIRTSCCVRGAQSSAYLTSAGHPLTVSAPLRALGR